MTISLIQNFFTSPAQISYQHRLKSTFFANFFPSCKVSPKRYKIHQNDTIFHQKRPIFRIFSPFFANFYRKNFPNLAYLAKKPLYRTVWATCHFIKLYNFFNNKYLSLCVLCGLCGFEKFSLKPQNFPLFFFNFGNK